MDEIYLLLKFLKKANKEIAEDPSDEKVILMKYITSLMGKVTGDAEKRLVKLARKKQPLQHLFDIYKLRETYYLSQATAIVTKSYDVMTPYMCPFFYDIDDGWYFYLDGNPILVDEQHCYGSISHHQSNESICDFICSYEQYKSGYYIVDLAIGIFLLDYYLGENCYEQTHEN